MGGCVLFQPSNTSAQALRVCVYPLLCLSTFPSSHLVACFLIQWFSYLEFPDDAHAAGLGTMLEHQCSKLSLKSLFTCHLLEVLPTPPLTPAPLVLSCHPHTVLQLHYPSGPHPGCHCHCLHASAHSGAPEAWLSHLRPLQSCSPLRPLKLTQQPQPITSLRLLYFLLLFTWCPLHYIVNSLR